MKRQDGWRATLAILLFLRALGSDAQETPWSFFPLGELTVPPILFTGEAAATPRMTSLTMADPGLIEPETLLESLRIELSIPELGPALLSLGLPPPARPSDASESTTKLRIRVTLHPPLERRNLPVKTAMRAVRKHAETTTFLPDPEAKYFVVRDVVATRRVSLDIPLTAIGSEARAAWLMAIAARGQRMQLRGDRLLVEQRFASPVALAFRGVEEVEFSRAATGSSRPHLKATTSDRFTRSIRVEAPEVQESGRELLLPGARGDAGYGLYSYLLLHHAAENPRQKASHTAAIESFLTIAPATDISRYVDALQLNVAYLPVLTNPGPEPTAEELRQSYDYARSQSYLSLFHCQGEMTGSPAPEYCGSWSQGPYMLSYWRPLPEVEKGLPPALFQDWTGYPADVIGLWMNSFLELVRTEQFGTPQSQTDLDLRVRTRLSQVAASLQDVRDASDEIAKMADDFKAIVESGATFIGMLWPRPPSPTSDP